MFGFRGVFARKPRQFDYRPRYYDTEAEAREQRKKEILGPGYKTKYDPVPEQNKPGEYIRNSMYVRRGIQRDKKSYTVVISRLVIVLAILGVLVWWLLNYFDASAEQTIRSLIR